MNDPVLLALKAYFVANSVDTFHLTDTLDAHSHFPLVIKIFVKIMFHYLYCIMLSFVSVLCQRLSLKKIMLLVENVYSWTVPGTSNRHLIKT